VPDRPNRRTSSDDLLSRRRRADPTPPERAASRRPTAGDLAKRTHHHRKAQTLGYLTPGSLQPAVFRLKTLIVNTRLQISHQHRLARTPFTNERTGRSSSPNYAPHRPPAHSFSRVAGSSDSRSPRTQPSCGRLSTGCEVLPSAQRSWCRVPP
jgi:hypothetical protein